ncbi:MAG: hypothetical protein EBS56_11975 [Planctomycetia bacterium]|nr:hypothetical protein [Planctomycetia bacterium]
MNFVSASKSVSKAETSVAANATHSVEIDTIGFAYASIDVVFSPFTAAATAAATVLRLAQSDSSGSGQANISGFVGGTDFTVAAGSTTGANAGYTHRFDVDLRGKKRYLTVYATPAATVGVVTVARLSKGEAGPTSASDKGVSTQVVG